MEAEKLEEFNEWWFTKAAPKELVKEHKRHLFKTIVDFLDKRQIISIVGLRRVGKTTIFYQLIDHLLKDKISTKNIFYFSFDEKAENMEDVINSYRENKQIDFRKEKTYIFLDEIQKLDNWANQVKKFFDLYPKIKFFLSGSEGFFLTSKTKETLAGRMYEFLLKPLSFEEYIELKGLNYKEMPAAGIKQLFLEFIKNGGFPEAIGKVQPELKMYVKSAVIDKIIFQDLVKTAKIKDTDLLKTLIEVIAANPGMYLEYQSLAKQLDRDRRLIKSYIMLLEQSFLVKIMANFRKGKLSSLRKIKRIYPADTSIIYSYKPVIDEDFFGKIVETAAINNSDSRFFWKNSREVDLVIEGIPIEVKFKEKVIGKDLSGIREFMRKFSKKKGIILTKDEEKQEKVPEGKIEYTPIWKWLLKANYT